MSDIVNGNIHLVKYGVRRCHFESYDVDPKKEFQLRPSFRRDIKKANGSECIYQLEMSVELESTDPQGEKPFDVGVSVYGVFELVGLKKDDQQRVMETNATAIVFPMLRTQLALLMTMAEVKPLVLPVMNMPALFNSADENE